MAAIAIHSSLTTEFIGGIPDGWVIGEPGPDSQQSSLVRFKSPVKKGNRVCRGQGGIKVTNLEGAAERTRMQRRRTNDLIPDRVIGRFQRMNRKRCG